MITYEGCLKSNASGQLFIYNKEQFHDFFRENPSSDFTFIATKVSSERSNKLFAYYYAEVIPKCIEGFRKLGENHNKGSVEIELKKYSPVIWKFEMIDGQMLALDRDFKDLNFFEKRRHIEEVIIFAAKDLDTIIEEPK